LLNSIDFASQRLLTTVLTCQRRVPRVGVVAPTPPVPLPPLPSWRTEKEGELASPIFFFHNILQRRQPPAQRIASDGSKKGEATATPRACDPTGKGEKSPRRNPRKATGSNGGCLVLLDLAPCGQWRRARRRGSGRRGTHRRWRRGRRVCISSSPRSRARRRRLPPPPRPRRGSRRSSRSTGPCRRCSPGWTRTRRPRRMSPSLSASARSGSVRSGFWSGAWFDCGWIQEMWTDLVFGIRL